MSIALGPKLRQLSPTETLASLEQWRQNVVYNLSLNASFTPYVDMVFGKKSRSKPHRSLEADDTTVANAQTAAQKCVVVDLMLDQVANWAPLIARNDITRDCESLDQVWQVIRLFYNLQTSGALLNEAWNVTRHHDETPQALYSRIKQLYDDNLLKVNGLNHLNEPVTEDEELSPTLHSTIVLHWLQVLNPKLRDLVTQRFATELRKCTYATLYPDISRSITELLAEVEDKEAVVNRAYSHGYGYSSRGRGSGGRGSSSRGSHGGTSGYKSRNCEYCRLAGRNYQNHDIDNCFHLRREKQHARSVESGEFYDEEQCDEYPPDDQFDQMKVHVINSVSVYSSPVLPLFHQGEQVRCTLDSGATCSIINTAKAKQMNLPIRPTRQRARMADGKTPLHIDGQTNVTFHRNGQSLHMVALVANFTDTDILGGMDFLIDNDIGLRPARQQIMLRGGEIVSYQSSQKRRPVQSLNRVTAVDVVVPRSEVVLPGESLSVAIPEWISTPSVAIEPRYDSSSNRLSNESSLWPAPQVAELRDGVVNLVNSSDQPILVKRHDKLCKVYPESFLPDDASSDSDQPVIPFKPPKKVSDYSSGVELNVDKVLSPASEVLCKKALQEYDGVFNPTISRYNGHSGPCSAEVNMGPSRPPQRKGRVPMYSRGNLQDLQDKCDELESKGVLAKPSELGISVEYVSPSFLVKKSSGAYRLVTDFNSISPFIKPLPSLMPDVNSTLHRISSWKYLIKTDLTEAYYQIPLKRSAMKYCGIVTPYKGTRVYTVGCMGLPGVESALEELTCLVFGDLVAAGMVAKLADDLYIGASTEEELIDNFRVVLQRLHENNLRLSARKTQIAPRSCVILGWTWTSGKLSASAHRIAALSSCSQPTTVSALKSFIGAYRFLGRVLRGHALLLQPLEAAVAGKEKNSKIVWTDELDGAFKAAQLALRDNKSITLPVPSDHLWIVTDGSLKNRAVGATLYVVRNGVQKLGGFFSAQVPIHQAGWLACEVEGIGISSALHHFAPLIRQSDHPPKVLTDSKPCVQACAKFRRGEFSTSARLCTFLNSIGMYRAEIRHLSGSANLVSDFSSRNPVPCDNDSCQMCKFVNDTCESVVGLVVEDVISDRSRLPFTSKPAWKETQAECRDLRQVKFCLQQGSVPPKRQKNMRDVRRYLSAGVLLNSDGVLVARDVQPFKPVVDRVVVPKAVLHGILTALHIQLTHPSAYQMKKVFARYFFALSMDQAVERVTSACEKCAAIRDVPSALIEQSTSDPPKTVGVCFAADVIKRERQLIFIMRETVTSYTVAGLIGNETATCLRDAIISACCRLRPDEATRASIRVDPAPGFQSLFMKCDDQSLHSHNISLEIGRFKNRNKNPVIDKAIKELIRELRLLSPHGGQISTATLDLAVASLNTRHRDPGMSAHELWTQRDQVSGVQFDFSDSAIISAQHERRQRNHGYSEASKAHGKGAHDEMSVGVGDLVYIYTDGCKLGARPRYMVIGVSDGWCKARKLHKGVYSSRVYDLKLREVYRVPGFSPADSYCSDSSSSYEDSSYVPQVFPSESVDHPVVDVDQGVVFPQAPVSPVPLRHETPVMVTPPGTMSTGPPNRMLRPRATLRRPSSLNDYVLD